MPLEWNQEDYDRLEELTLLELRKQHERVLEVVENHNKDIKKVRRSIAALTNKYTLVECNPEDSDKKRKRVAERNFRVPPQWSLHDIAELEQLQVTLGILITDKEMVRDTKHAHIQSFVVKMISSFLKTNIHQWKSILTKKKKLTTKKQKLRKHYVPSAPRLF